MSNGLLYDGINMIGYFAEEEPLDGQRRKSRGVGGGGSSGRVRTIKLESAPLILILHLKQFYFDPVHGPMKKGLKTKYEDELEVGCVGVKFHAVD